MGNQLLLAILFHIRPTQRNKVHNIPWWNRSTYKQRCMQYIVHDDETMDNPYCNHCGCGMPFSGRLVWSTQQFGPRSSFSNTIAMPFSLFSPHITASSLFLGLACPLLGNFTQVHQLVLFQLLSVARHQSRMLTFFNLLESPFFRSLQKDVYEQMCEEKNVDRTHILGEVFSLEKQYLCLIARSIEAICTSFWR